jgi:hypothetical protein
MIEKADCVLRKIQSTLVVLLAAGTLHAQDTGQGGQTTGNNPSTVGHILEYANYNALWNPSGLQLPSMSVWVLSARCS